MSRSVSNLRRALSGVSCAIVFGFGATQAFAMPDPFPPARLACSSEPGRPGVPYYTDFCAWGCEEGFGYCGADQECYCGYMP